MGSQFKRLEVGGYKSDTGSSRCGNFVFIYVTQANVHMSLLSGRFVNKQQQQNLETEININDAYF